MKTILLFFIFTFSLFASSEQKIIIGSLPDAVSAKKAFEKFQSRLDANFSDLQQQYGFDTVARTSGRSYIIVLEPFRNYQEAKALKDILPKSYADAFINRYSPSQDVSIIAIMKVKEIEIVETTTIIEEEIPTKVAPEVKTPEINLLYTPKEEPTVSEVIIEEVKSEPTQEKVTESIEKFQEVTITPLAVSKQNNQKNFSKFLYILIALVLILIPLIAFVLKLYQNNKILQTKISNYESIFANCFEEKEDLLATLKSKDAFLDNLTLNLKTSIDTILSSSHSLNDASLNRKERESFEKITTSTSKVNEVINNIIDITKLRSNRLELEKIKFNLNNILETTANSVHKQAQKKRIEITFDIDTTLPIRFIGDPLRMNQILTNMLHHSISNTDDGEIIISVKEHKRSKNFIDLKFTIKDTGIGYKQDEVNTVFQDFANTNIYNVDSNVKIGLVMSKHLINKMGGDIELKSSYGHGSSFIFNIILGLPEKVELRKYHLPYKKIMDYSAVIIDNNVLAARVLRQQLEYFHLKVKPSFSWEHAVKLIHDEFNQIDFIIINSTILGETSIEDLAKTAEKREFQIVFIVHDMRDINYQVIEKFKYAHFLHKPYTQKKLFDLLVKIHENNLRTQS